MRMPSRESQRGVINPLFTHVHPYPTRFHGATYTRPVFGLPYAPAPHAVFKPTEFHEFYEDDAGSTAGLGSLAGGSLGLGATGAAIYYLASSTNTKVSTLQTALNKVLLANGYKVLVTVTGKLDATTCGALGVCLSLHKEDLLSQAPQEIINEAANICSSALKTAAVQKQVQDFIAKLKNSRVLPVTAPATVAAPATPATAAVSQPTLSASDVVVIQQSINSVLRKNGYPIIQATGTWDKVTLFAFSALFESNMQSELSATMPSALFAVAQGVWNSTDWTTSLRGEAQAFAKWLSENRVEPETTPVVVDKPVTAPTATPVPVITVDETLPDMQITAQPAPKTLGKGAVVGAALLGLGALWYFSRK